MSAGKSFKHEGIVLLSLDHTTGCESTSLSGRGYLSLGVRHQWAGQSLSWSTPLSGRGYLSWSTSLSARGYLSLGVRHRVGGAISLGVRH